MRWTQRAISLVSRAVNWFASAVERHKVLVVLGYSIVFLAICALLSATKLLWYDEMATYYPAKLPTVSQLVDFFWTGLDVHTPTASLFLRGVMRVFGDGPVVDRLPFAFAYLIFCICIFVFVARRCPAVYATAAMIFPTLTLMFYYATEIRCYALVLALTGTALVSWQLATDGINRKLCLAALFVSLTAAISCHYYAVFLLIPFGLAELTRTWMRKRIDWPVWAALVLSPGIILLFLPAIHAAHASYAGGMLAVTPRLGQITSSYLYVLSISNAPILGAAIVCLLLAPSVSRPQPGAGRIPVPDWILAGGLSLLPFFVVPASLKIGAFSERYILPCVAGIAILLTFALCRAFRGDRLVGTVLTLFFLGWFVFKSTGELRSQRASNGGLGIPLGQPLRNANWVSDLGRSDLPIAVAPAVFFMTVQEYVPEGIRARVHYLANQEMARLYGDIPSNDTNLIRFSQALPLPVVDFQTFVTGQRHFLIVMESEHPNWLVPALLERGAQLSLRTRSGSNFVFEVTMR